MARISRINTGFINVFIPLLALFLFPSFVFPQIFSDSFYNTEEAVMPAPYSSIKTEGCYYKAGDDFTFMIKGPGSDKIDTGIKRFCDRLGVARGNKEKPDVVIGYTENETVRHGMKEGYVLAVAEDVIALTAGTDIGIIRGLETLLQICAKKDGKLIIPCGSFLDSPRFPWRGLLIDACRHFMPVEMVKRNIDVMTAVKLNVLHWHLSEDQGFRVECKTFPLLHEKGSDGDYYTQEQIKDVIKYANDRGIRVVPEFDIPGHSSAWFAAYPEHASGPGPYSIEKYFGVFDPTFNPAREETYGFFDKFFAEMSRLFNDEYIHIGGDENEGKEWDANAEIQEFKNKMGFKSNHELQLYFTKRIQKILTGHGRKMIGWDEIYSPDLPRDIVIHSWRGKEAMIKSAREGFSSVLSNGYYIDLNQSVFDHYYNDPLPDGSGLNDTEKKLILGGEATMWAELVNNENVDSRIWPRTAAIAEVLWSGVKRPYADSLENNLFLIKRLKKVSQYLEMAGSRHASNRELMLRKYHGEENYQLYKYIVDVCEPLKYYNRHKYKKYDRFTPLNRLVDIAVADAPLSFEFAYLTDKIIKGSADAADVRRAKEFFGMTGKMCRDYFRNRADRPHDKFSEEEYLIERFGNISSLIYALLGAYETKTRTGEERIKDFSEYKTPVAELEFSIVPGVEKLYNFIEDGKHIR